MIKKGAKAKSDETIEAIKSYNIETDLAKKLELALAAVKSKKQPYFAVKYGRLKKRRGHKKQSLPLHE